MTSESPAIRVQPLTSVLDGEVPAEFVHRLSEAGYDRFYVKVPKGFQVSLLPRDPFPPGYQLYWRRQSANVPPQPNGNQPKIRYMQLDTPQMRGILEYSPIALNTISAGGLEYASARDGLPPIDFKYRKGPLGALLPTEASIADKVPTEVDARSVGPVVVKTLDLYRNLYSYVLHGISLKDVFVEETALRTAVDSIRTAKSEPASVCEDLPDDPHGLRESSPLVYEILRKAYENRDKTRDEIDTPSLAAEFRKLNVPYKINPKPFNDGRHKFAATLSNPFYSYSSDGPNETELPEETVEVPADTFLDQIFINERFRKLLYAACCWSGAMEPRLGRDREKLVHLLVGLGFFDRDDSDPVQASVFFITGEKYRRNKHNSEFRHMRGDRG